jgi:hypothetical protein
MLPPARGNHASIARAALCEPYLYPKLRPVMYALRFDILLIAHDLLLRWVGADGAAGKLAEDIGNVIDGSRKHPHGPLEPRVLASGGVRS